MPIDSQARGDLRGPRVEFAVGDARARERHGHPIRVEARLVLEHRREVQGGGVMIEHAGIVSC